MLDAGAVDVLQADATRCGGITGFLRRAALCEAHWSAALGAHCAPSLHAHVCCAARPRAAPRVFPRPRPHRAACSSTARRSPSTARPAPDLSRPGHGPRAQARATPRASPSEHRMDRRAHAIRTQPTHAHVGRRSARDRGRRRARGRAARGRSRARSASTPAAARSTRPTPRTTARCRSASSSRATADDVVATVARLPRARRAAPLARRRHQPRRPVLQRRRRHRLLQVPAPRPRARSRAQRSARVEPGVRARRRCATRPSSIGLTFGPDPATHTHCTLGGMIGNNSCGVHSLMAGHGTRSRQRRGAGHPAPTTACACASGATSDDELDAHHRARAAGAARSTPSCARCATATRDLIRARYPGHPAPRLRLQPRPSCCPRTASTSRARWSAPRAPASPSSRRRVAPDPQPAGARRCSSLGYPGRLRRRPTTSPRSCAHQPDRPRGHRRPPRSTT